MSTYPIDRARVWITGASFTAMSLLIPTTFEWQGSFPFAVHSATHMLSGLAYPALFLTPVMLAFGVVSLVAARRLKPDDAIEITFDQIRIPGKGCFARSDIATVSISPRSLRARSVVLTTTAGRTVRFPMVYIKSAARAALEADVAGWTPAV